MIAFVVRRLVTALVVVLLATIVVFALVSARGDPLRDLRHRPGVSQQTIHNLEHEYHLDESRPEQYLDWLGDFVQGDWGTSFRTERPVTDMVGEATWNSFLLVGTAVVLSVILAMLIGVVSAVRQHSAFDYAATVVLVLRVLDARLLLRAAAPALRGDRAPGAARHPRAATCRASTPSARRATSST